MFPTYNIAVDWLNDGDFVDPGDDVSTRVMDRTGLSVQYGRDQDRSLSPIAPGEASFELDNQSRDYSPENTSSPLAGNILPSRPVRVQATFNGTTYGLYRGFLDDFTVQPAIESRSVTVSCVDLLAKFKGVQLSTGLFSGLTTGQAIGLILDELDWPADKRDIDDGATSVPWWWEEGTDAFDALSKLVNSEGPPAFVFVDGTQNFVFRDRHHRLIRPASMTSQATFSSGGVEPLFSAPLNYDHGWRDIVNSVSFSIGVRQPDGAQSVVWSSDATVTLADGETKMIQAVGSNPFMMAVAPSGDDITVQSGVVTAALSRTSGQSTTILLTASGGPAVVTSLQLQAVAVPVVSTVQIQASDSTSITQYGLRSWPNDAGFAGVNDAAAIADIILAYRAQRLPIVEFDVRGTTGADVRLVQQLSRDLSDRITVVEPETGLNSDFFIERIKHQIGGLLHVTTFGCEMAPRPTLGGFTFGATGLGFDQGSFVARGLDNPGSVFRFDAAGTSLMPTDGTFEVAGTTGWSASAATFAVDSANVHTGTKAAKLTVVGTPTQAFARTPQVAVTVGEPYSLTFWAFATVDVANVQVVIDWFGSGGVLLTSSFATLTSLPANTWTQLTVTGTAPASAALARVGPTLQSNPASGTTIWVDDVTFVHATNGFDLGLLGT